MRATLDVEGHEIVVTHRERVLAPETGFTKGDLVAYYASVGAAMVPHLARRPLMLGRWPSGVHERGWGQFECRGRPEWMSAFELHMRDGRVVETCVVDDVASLVWLANQGVLEFHPFLARAEAFDRPTAMVFDLDPGAPAGLVECAQVALRLRDVLAAVGLISYVKGSGSIGMHVVVPLNTPVTYAETKSFARAVATLLAHEDPARVVDVMTRARRSGKVFVDWAQNDERKQNIAPYSLRAAAGVPVSAPITWEEAASADHTRFGPREVLDRVRDRGDVFAQVPTMRQQLPRLHA